MVRMWCLNGASLRFNVWFNRLSIDKTQIFKPHWYKQNIAEFHHISVVQACWQQPSSPLSIFLNAAGKMAEMH